jgi:hypothetical protein
MNLTGQAITEAKTLDGVTPRMTATDEFIEVNNLELNRTQDEMVERFREESGQMFDFASEILLYYIDFGHVKEFLKAEAVEQFEKGEKVWDCITDIRITAQDFLDYINFAWGKALDERGISASRSIQKLSMWLWLMGRDDLVQTIENDRLYNPYGAPALIAVSEALSIPVPDELREFAKHKC